MNVTLRMATVAGVLALAFARAAAAPLAGTWEGSLDGRKAVSLELREQPRLAGTIVFYILRDNGTGQRNGEAVPAAELQNVRWDGERLRFDVAAGGRIVGFEMRPDAEGHAKLIRLDDRGNPEFTIALSALR